MPGPVFNNTTGGVESTTFEKKFFPVILDWSQNTRNQIANFVNGLPKFEAEHALIYFLSPKVITAGDIESHMWLFLPNEGTFGLGGTQVDAKAILYRGHTGGRGSTDGINDIQLGNVEASGATLSKQDVVNHVNANGPYPTSSGLLNVLVATHNSILYRFIYMGTQSEIGGAAYVLELDDISADINNTEEQPATAQDITIPSPTNFTGILDVSGGLIPKYYNDYIEGDVVNPSLSETKVLGSTAIVRIKGDLMGTIPESWNFSGQATTQTPSKFNELTILYVNDEDIRIVNRIVTIPDTEAPTVPTGLASSSIGDTSTDIAWNASTDNIAVAEYKVYKDGVLEQTVVDTSATIEGLTPSSTYAFTVSAVDGAGNESVQSASIDVTTLAAVITPSSLSTLDVWFDGTDDSTMALNASSRINSFTAKNTAFSLTGTGTLFPLFNTDKIVFNEANALVSSGTARSLISPLNDFHGFIIFKNTSIKDYDFLSNTVNSAERFAISHRAGELRVGIYNGAFNCKSIAFTDQTAFHKLEFKHIGGVVTAYLDGVEMTGTNNIFSTTSVGFFLGGINGNNAKAIEFKDFFIQAGEMTASKRNDMLSYISTKHGL